MAKILSCFTSIFFGFVLGFAGQVCIQEIPGKYLRHSYNNFVAPILLFFPAIGMFLYGERRESFFFVLGATGGICTARIVHRK